jgi:predicted nucleic acid-binding protein
MIILDTKVLSEALRPKPANSVERWIEAQPPTALFTTAICEAEILSGVRLMPAGRRRDALERAVKAIFAEDFADRVLPFDTTAATAFAEIASRRRSLGRPIAEFDAQIAAIAASHGAAVATRNILDFADCGIKIICPWED